MKDSEHLLRPIYLLWQKKNLILLFTLLAAILAVIVVLVKPNYYKSTSLMYPASPDLAMPQPIGNQDQKMEYYGTSGDLDRLFSIAKSNEMKRFLIDSFDLYTHYDIDPSGSKAEYAIDLLLNKLFEAEKTKYDALKLSIEDKSPEMAKAMVNAATNKLNEIGQRVVKESQAALLQSYSSNIQAKTENLATMSETINNLRTKYNIFDLENQGTSYAELFSETSSKYANLKSKYASLKAQNAPQDSLRQTKANLDGVQAQYISLQEQIKTFNQGYIPLFNAEQEQETFTNQLGLDRQRLAQLQAAYNSPFSAIILIEQGDLPNIKSRPLRTFIVLGTAIAAFLFMCLLVLVLDVFKNTTFEFEK